MSIQSSNDGSTNKFIRHPTKRVLIEDLYQGNWNDSEKIMVTRYGNTKRARILGTIIDKREIIEENPSESFISDNTMSRSRVSFLIDDGTGRIYATLWGARPEDYKRFTKGNLVDLGGVVRIYKNRPTLTFDFITKIENVNFEIYNLLEVLQKRKINPPISNTSVNQSSQFEIKNNSGNTNSNSIKGEEEYMDEIAQSPVNPPVIASGPLKGQGIEPKVIHTENSSAFKDLDLPQQIIHFIETNDTGDGTSIKDIGQSLSIEENKLKNIIEQLCQDVKVYKVRPGHYSAYKE